MTLLLLVLLLWSPLLTTSSSSSPVVLITGANGFLGSHAASAFLQEGYTVRALVRTSKDADALRQTLRPRDDRFSVLIGDVRDAAAMAKAVAGGVDTVVHSACVMDFFPDSDARKDEMRDVNIGGTQNLLRACEHAGVSRFIYISSTEALGSCDMCHEDVAPHPDFYYGETKVEAEALVRSANLSHIILRPTGIFGPGDFFSMYQLIEMVWLGLLFFVPGDGKTELMYTHVDDVTAGVVNAARALQLAAMPASINQTYILAPDAGLSFGQWIKVIAKEVGRTRPLFSLPLPVVKAVTHVLKPVMNLGRARSFMYEARTVEMMERPRTYSNSKARALLGFAPAHSLEDQVRETIAWYKGQGYFRPLPLSPLLILVGTITLLIVLWRKLRAASSERALKDKFS